MNKIPETNIEWAKEAYDALCLAHIYFKEEFESPTEKEKLELFAYAVPLAVKNRGIEDDEIEERITSYVYEKLSHDVNPLMEGESIHHSIRFLNAYLDANVVLSVLPEEKVTDIMVVLDSNYAIDIPA